MAVEACGIGVQSVGCCIMVGGGTEVVSGELLCTVVEGAFALAGVTLGRRGTESLVGVRLSAAAELAWFFRDAAALPLRGRSFRD